MSPALYMSVGGWHVFEGYYNVNCYSFLLPHAVKSKPPAGDLSSECDTEDEIQRYSSLSTLVVTKVSPHYNCTSGFSLNT